jgi:membrane fusion protein (multidrug efflux system)
MGEVLVELESESEKLSFAEQRTRVQTLEPQIEALHQQMAALDRGRHEERTVLNVAVEEAGAKYREAEAHWKQAELEADRSRRLHDEKLVSDADFQKAKAEAESKRAAAESLKIAVTRLDPELRVRESERETRRRQMASDLAKLEADMSTSTATMKRLEWQIERRKIRSSTGGRLGDCAVLRPGCERRRKNRHDPTWRRVACHCGFSAGCRSRTCAARPTGNSTAAGFPLGAIWNDSSQGARVASEIRDGRVRVELALDSHGHSRAPLQHGLPGAVEVEVERVSPASLVLRTAGQMMANH